MWQVDEGAIAADQVTWPDDFPSSWTGCPQRPLLELLNDAIDQHGDHIVLTFDDSRSYTGRELRVGAQRLAGYLRERVDVGDRVALAVGNRAEFVMAYLAVLANRAVVLAIPPEIGPHDARFVLSDSGCRIAIADEVSAPTFKSVDAELPELHEVIEVKGEEPHGFEHALDGVVPISFAAVEAELSDMVDIGYTSGTTGLPKALGGSHLELLRYLDVHLRTRSGGEDHRVLCPLQFHYGDPLASLFAAILGRTSVIVMRRFSASRFWTVARDLGATEITTIGSIPDMLLAQPEGPDDRSHSVRLALALAIPPTRHAELERRFGFPWREIYGSSESGPALAMPPAFGNEFVGTGAVGIPFPDINARLVTEADEVVEGPGVGELELSGLVTFEGYVGNDEATAEVLHDGWLRTGDIMRRDDRGVYYFEGRRKELIRRSGINVAPAEVEGVLRLHADVVDAAVVPVHDDMMGEEIKAYVELVVGALFDPQGLAEHCAARLSKHKVPRYIEHRVTPFPRTPTQRIPKNELKVGGIHGTTQAWDRLKAERTKK